MYLESFRQIIEIESLKFENLKNLQNIESEKKRTARILEQKMKAKQDLESFTQELQKHSLKKTLDQINSSKLSLEKLKTQELAAKNQIEAQAFQKQIELKTRELGELEEFGFEQLQREEFLENEINRLQEFLKGIETTFSEISFEVAQNIAKENLVIEGRIQRINNLHNLCRTDLLDIYLALLKKFIPKSPISILSDKKCQNCFIQVDSALKSSLEEGRSIEVCPHCSRLLIPETVKIF